MLAAQSRKLRSFALVFRSCQVSTTVSQRGFFKLHKLVKNPAVQAFQSRAFASLPDYIKLEMPNLSPTMEKVSHL
jgi:hypothetical protein